MTTSPKKKTISGKIPYDAFCLIIGAMKAGTSSLYLNLVKHPQICPCVIKEPEYFSGIHQYENKVEKYEDLWDFDPKIHKYALEASTRYTMYPLISNIPESILRYGLNPKIIYIVRNPFDRTLSQYNYFRYKRFYGRKKNILVNENVINRSKYYFQLDQYRSYFPKENFLILDFEDLKNDPHSLLVKVYKFLNLPVVENSDQFSVANKTVVLSKFQRFMKRNNYLRIPYLLIPQGVRNIGKKIFKKYSDQEETIQLTDQDRKIIHDGLIDDMRLFHDEYGFNVKKWGFDVGES